MNFLSGLFGGATGGAPLTAASGGGGFTLTGGGSGLGAGKYGWLVWVVAGVAILGATLILITWLKRN